MPPVLETRRKGPEQANGAIARTLASTNQGLRPGRRLPSSIPAYASTRPHMLNSPHDRSLVALVVALVVGPEEIGGIRADCAVVL